MSANYSSPRGPISIEWHRHNTSAISLTADIPVGVDSALVSVPTPSDATEVREGGVTMWARTETGLAGPDNLDHLAAAAHGLEWVATAPDAISFRAGSGRYQFEAANSNSVTTDDSQDP